MTYRINRLKQAKARYRMNQHIQSDSVIQLAPAYSHNFASK